MRLFRSLLPVFLFLVVLPLAAQNLEIHYIDVGWGGSVFIKGPTGITVLLEAGDTGMGTSVRRAVSQVDRRAAGQRTRLRHRRPSALRSHRRPR